MDDIDLIPAIFQKVYELHDRGRTFACPRGWPLHEPEEGLPPQIASLLSSRQRGMLWVGSSEQLRVSLEALFSQAQTETFSFPKSSSWENQQPHLLALLDRKLRAAEAERYKLNVDAQINREKVVSDADLRLKMQKCHDPDVQHLLEPMLDKGYWQPGDGHDAYGRIVPSSIDPSPMSLNRMRAAGALARTRDGLAILYDIGENHHGQQDRQKKMGV